MRRAAAEESSSAGHISNLDALREGCLACQLYADMASSSSAAEQVRDASRPLAAGAHRDGQRVGRSRHRLALLAVEPDAGPVLGAFAFFQPGPVGRPRNGHLAAVKPQPLAPMGAGPGALVGHGQPPPLAAKPAPTAAARARQNTTLTSTVRAYRSFLPVTSQV